MMHAFGCFHCDETLQELQRHLAPRKQWVEAEGTVHRSARGYWFCAVDRTDLGGANNPEGEAEYLKAVEMV